MQSFPGPLGANEESDCIRRCREGDRTARNKLIEHNLRLVAYLAKKYNTNGRNLDDLISIGTIGLIKAIDTYDAKKGVRLATYASRCIDNELLMMLRSDKKQTKEVYLYEPIGMDDGEGNHISLLDILETTDEDIAERMELEENISKLGGYVQEALTPREREIITLRYGLEGRKEVTQREIAKRLGISRSYVSRIQKRALGKLRKCYREGKKKA